MKPPIRVEQGLHTDFAHREIDLGGQAFGHENADNPHPIVAYEGVVITHNGKVVYKNL